MPDWVFVVEWVRRCQVAGYRLQVKLVNQLLVNLFLPKSRFLLPAISQKNNFLLDFRSRSLYLRKLELFKLLFLLI